jgi:hypothetical protein
VLSNADKRASAFPPPDPSAAPITRRSPNGGIGRLPDRGVHPSRGFPGGLAAITEVSLTDHDHRRLGDQGDFLKDCGPQKMLVEHPGGADYIWSHSRFFTFVYSIREEL